MMVSLMNGLSFGGALSEVQPSILGPVGNSAGIKYSSVAHSDDGECSDKRGTLNRNVAGFGDVRKTWEVEGRGKDINTRDLRQE